jgi:hypothetical protein
MGLTLTEDREPLSIGSFQGTTTLTLEVVLGLRFFGEKHECMNLALQKTLTNSLLAYLDLKSESWQQCVERLKKEELAEIKGNRGNKANGLT